MKSVLVLYPSPGIGHLISMVELGKSIIAHNPSLSITVLISPPSFNTGATDVYIRRISAAEPSISFHRLPLISFDFNSFPTFESIIFEVVRRSNPYVSEALHAISRSSTVSAFVIDFFCAAAQDIAVGLRIPTYYYYTSGAGTLAILLYLPVLHRLYKKSFGDLNEILSVPGFPPFPSSDMILPVLDRDSTDYADFLQVSRCFRTSQGVLVNTFESLEIRALAAIRAGDCTPGDVMPPVFCVGPLMASPENGGADAENDCIKWLDKQPSRSVLFICFGSVGLLSASQLTELAIGLERSGQRFVWVVRSPPTEDKSKRFLRPPDPDVEGLLPEGFIRATEERGLVVKSWAPQVAILNHEAVGGFVTHCGWNSILEAISVGVPMVAWPLYAEQKLNRVYLADLKLAVAVEMDDDGRVPAEEVERCVLEIMSEKGKQMREAITEMKAEAAAAISAGGSSIASLDAVVAQLW
ncbi:hypothetical protein M569_01144 [Genlisea aurea]|uniref:Glycosyltransferase n=1 Tax=Genlisea aurea TaxID=192259 RepID=S8D2I2_9LAMI|nr:hypothetical protein M569_01144 [Genlisea aurea]